MEGDKAAVFSVRVETQGCLPGSRGLSEFVS